MDPSAYITLLITGVIFTGIWLIHVSQKDAGVIDFYWGPGFVVIGAVTLWLNGTVNGFQLLFMGAVSLWAARLTLHLGRRHLAATSEDGRYKAMRAQGGPSFWWTSLFKVFLLQAVILWMVASPVHMVMRTAEPTNLMPQLWSVGLVIFAIGFAIEWIADYQLATAKQAEVQSDHGRAVRLGLWSASRHPNYLGEMILWWGLGLAAFAYSGALLSLAGPLLLTVVMIAISIPLTEQHLRANKKGYDAYARRVPMLLPALVRATPAREKTGA